MASYDTQLYLNPQAQEFKEYGPAQLALLNQEAFARARAEIASWPGYAPTPLMALGGLAAANGIGALWCKYGLSDAQQKIEIEEAWVAARLVADLKSIWLCGTRGKKYIYLY